jgi:hypothetical protein
LSKRLPNLSSYKFGGRGKVNLWVYYHSSPFVTHDFGHHDDVLIMVYSGYSLEPSPEKSYLHLFSEITFLRKVRRLLIHLPTRMHDSRKLL